MVFVENSWHMAFTYMGSYSPRPVFCYVDSKPLALEGYKVQLKDIVVGAGDVGEDFLSGRGGRNSHPLICLIINVPVQLNVGCLK